METAVLNGMLAVRVGCSMEYEPREPSHLLVMARVRPAPGQTLVEERLETDPAVAMTEHTDVHGNRVARMTLPAGATTVRHDAIVLVPSAPEDDNPAARQAPAESVPPDILPYTLPSRYCDSDKLLY